MMRFDRTKKKRNIIVGAAIFLAVFLLFIFIRLGSFYSNISTSGESWGNVVPKEKTIFTVLMMGYGGPGHEGAYLTDTMMLARIDLETNKVLMVSIPRDIWINIPTSSGDAFNSKINAAYQTGLFREKYPDVKPEYEGEQGAADLVKHVVADITGFDVDYFVTIDFDGFKEAVDTMGGVDIQVEKSFTDVKYPITGMENDLCGVDANDLEKIAELELVATDSPQLAYPCRYEVLTFNAGEQHMDGETALKFVRSRHSAQDGGDFNRAKRQQLFLQAIKENVLSIGFIPKIIPLMSDLEENIRTDIPLEVMQKFLKEASNLDEYEIKQIVLDTDTYLANAVSDDGQYILVSSDGYLSGGIDEQSNWARLQKDLQNYVDGVSPTPSISGTTVTGTVQKKFTY